MKKTIVLLIILFVSVPCWCVPDSNFTATYSAGWNMISIPVDSTVSTAKEKLGGDNMLGIWKYEAGGDGWSIPAYLYAKKGYWVKLQSPKTVNWVGQYPTNPLLTLYPGWSFIGPVTPISNPWGRWGENGSNVIYAMWGYNPVEAWKNKPDALLPGMAYWIKGTTSLAPTMYVIGDTYTPTPVACTPIPPLPPNGCKSSTQKVDFDTNNEAELILCGGSTKVTGKGIGGSKCLQVKNKATLRFRIIKGHNYCVYWSTFPYDYLYPPKIYVDIFTTPFCGVTCDNTGNGQYRYSYYPAYSDKWEDQHSTDTIVTSVGGSGGIDITFENKESESTPEGYYVDNVILIDLTDPTCVPTDTPVPPPTNTFTYTPTETNTPIPLPEFVDTFDDCVAMPNPRSPMVTGYMPFGWYGYREPLYCTKSNYVEYTCNTSFKSDQDSVEKITILGGTCVPVRAGMFRRVPIRREYLYTVSADVYMTKRGGKNTDFSVCLGADCGPSTSYLTPISQDSPNKIDYYGASLHTFNEWTTLSVEIDPFDLNSSTYIGEASATLWLIATSSSSVGFPFNTYIDNVRCYKTLPANDNFENATEITGTSGHLTGNTKGATRQLNEPIHSYLQRQGTDSDSCKLYNWCPKISDHSVWYKYVVTGDKKKSIAIDTGGSSFGNTLNVYTGEYIYNLVSLASNESDYYDTTNKAQVSFDAQPGIEYYIAVDSAYAGGVGYLKFGRFLLNYYSTENDYFVDAITLTGNSGTVVGNNMNASGEDGEPSHESYVSGGTVLYFPPLQSLWYKISTSEENKTCLLSTYGSKPGVGRTSSYYIDDIWSWNMNKLLYPNGGMACLFSVYTGNSLENLVHVPNMNIPFSSVWACDEQTCYGGDRANTSRYSMRMGLDYYYGNPKITMYLPSLADFICDKFFTNAINFRWYADSFDMEKDKVYYIAVDSARKDNEYCTNNCDALLYGGYPSLSYSIVDKSSLNRFNVSDYIGAATLYSGVTDTMDIGWKSVGGKTVATDSNSTHPYANGKYLPCGDVWYKQIKIVPHMPYTYTYFARDVFAASYTNQDMRNTGITFCDAEKFNIDYSKIPALDSIIDRTGLYVHSNAGTGSYYNYGSHAFNSWKLRASNTGTDASTDLARNGIFSSDSGNIIAIIRNPRSDVDYLEIIPSKLGLEYINSKYVAYRTMTPIPENQIVPTPTLVPTNANYKIEFATNKYVYTTPTVLCNDVLPVKNGSSYEDISFYKILSNVQNSGNGQYAIEYDIDSNTPIMALFYIKNANPEFATKNFGSSNVSYSYSNSISCDGETLSWNPIIPELNGIFYIPYLHNASIDQDSYVGIVKPMWNSQLSWIPCPYQVKARLVPFSNVLDNNNNIITCANSNVISSVTGMFIFSTEGLTVDSKDYIAKPIKGDWVTNEIYDRRYDNAYEGVSCTRFDNRVKEIIEHCEENTIHNAVYFNSKSAWFKVVAPYDGYACVDIVRSRIMPNTRAKVNMTSNSLYNVSNHVNITSDHTSDFMGMNDSYSNVPAHYDGCPESLILEVMQSTAPGCSDVKSCLNYVDTLYPFTSTVWIPAPQINEMPLDYPYPTPIGNYGYNYCNATDTGWLPAKSCEELPTPVSSIPTPMLLDTVPRSICEQARFINIKNAVQDANHVSIWKVKKDEVYYVRVMNLSSLFSTCLEDLTYYGLMGRKYDDAMVVLRWKFSTSVLP